MYGICWCPTWNWNLELCCAHIKSKIAVSLKSCDVMKWDLANGHVIASNYAWTMTYSFVKRAEFLTKGLSCTLLDFLKNCFKKIKEKNACLFERTPSEKIMSILFGIRPQMFRREWHIHLSNLLNFLLKVFLAHC